MNHLAIVHGGNLREAQTMYGGELTDWLDLSTGILPFAYPVPSLPAAIWHRLPELDPALIHAARHYYGAPSVIPVAGTQSAIQALPLLRVPCRVAVLAPSYAEHALQWRKAGHHVTEYSYAELETQIAAHQVVVVCNPNNPTGQIIPIHRLLAWSESLAARGGWLIVDEAFIDSRPELSVAAWTHRQGLIVLRSLGKFFGLAGVRLGFVAARHDFLAALAKQTGPWSVNVAAQMIGTQALNDRGWQMQTREYLQQAGERLRQLLLAQGWDTQGCDLFRYLPHPDAVVLQQQLAQHKIWVRSWHGDTAALRFGLPATEADWLRLERALISVRKV